MGKVLVKVQNSILKCEHKIYPKFLLETLKNKFCNPKWAYLILRAPCGNHSDLNVNSLLLVLGLKMIVYDFPLSLVTWQL